MNRVRVLFVGCGPMMPLTQPMEKLKFEYFSKYFSGDIITSIMHAKHMAIKSIGQFGYHPFIASGNSVARNIKSIWNYISKAVKLHRRGGNYGIVIAPNPLLIGMIALFIGRIVKAKVIIEVNGNFESAFKYGEKGKIGPSRSEVLKEMFSRVAIPFVLKRADAVKLLADNQIAPFRLTKNSVRTKVFPDFVPIQQFLEHARGDKKYVLLLGYPWYLKGVDILIRAFNMISDDFPKYRLKIFGWCPENRQFYEDLAKPNPKIDLCDPVYYQEVVPIMSNCSLYVLASRTEAMGRVLIEAMACRKPVIASNVGGVYSLVRHGYNGLLYENENVTELAEKMRYVLSHADVADRFAENGFQHVQEHFSEECYLANYRRMILETMGMETC